jgi:hypothetical protein
MVAGNNATGNVVNGDPTSLGQSLTNQQANLAFNAGTNATGAVSLASKRMTGRSCQNCHSMIHGSNSPGGARFQR